LSHFHRALIGIAAGGVSSVVPMYIMELSPIDLRSIYGAMHQFGISFGIFFINFLGMWFDWHSLAIISLVIAATLTVSVAYIPESPTFHPGGNSRPEPKSQERLCGPQYFRYLMIGIMMMVFQQVSGVNAVLTNLGAILVSRSGPAMAASAQCFAVACCITFIDKIGRVNAWAVSLFGSAASMLVLAFALRFGWAAAIATGAGFGFFFFFCFGLGPIPWFLPPEFFPDKLRATATSIFSSLNWILSFSVVFLYPAMSAKVGVFLVMLFFAAVLTAGGVFGLVALKPPRAKVGGEAVIHGAAEKEPGFAVAADLGQ
jgi:MFS family permease